MLWPHLEQFMLRWLLFVGAGRDRFVNELAGEFAERLVVPAGQLAELPDQRRGHERHEEAGVRLQAWWGDEPQMHQASSASGVLVDVIRESLLAVYSMRQLSSLSGAQ